MIKIILIVFCLFLIIYFDSNKSRINCDNKLTKRQIVNMPDKSIIMPKSYINGMGSLKAAGFLKSIIFKSIDDYDFLRFNMFKF